MNISEQIAALDEVLKVHSTALKDAIPERKAFWQKKVDELLNRRIELMKQRDGKS